MRDQRGALAATEQLLGDEFDRVLEEAIPADMLGLLDQIDQVSCDAEQSKHAA